MSRKSILERLESNWTRCNLGFQLSIRLAPFLLLLVCSISCVTHSHEKPISLSKTKDSLYKGQRLIVTGPLQIGTATLDQAFEWSGKMHYMVPRDSFRSKEVDLENDGVSEVAVYSRAWAGNGGNLYLIFKQTPRGLRFFDTIAMGDFRSVERSEANDVLIVTLSRIGRDQCEAVLLGIKPQGFHEISKRLLNSEENVKAGSQEIAFEDLYKSNVLPEGVVKKAFALLR